MPFRIYVVEDHPLMQEMLQEFIREEPDLELCGTAGTGEDALAHIPAAAADLALIDVSLPRMTGIELVSELRRLAPALPCIMLSGHQESTYVSRAMAAGARGYILKGNPFEIVGAVRHVLDGGVYLSDRIRDLAPRDAPSPDTGRP